MELLVHGPRAFSFRRYGIISSCHLPMVRLDDDDDDCIDTGVVVIKAGWLVVVAGLVGSNLDRRGKLICRTPGP